MERKRHWLALIVAAPLFALGMGGCKDTPTITIGSPAHGTFTTDATLSVTGTVASVNLADAEVRVNGTIVPLTGSTWSHPMTVSPTAVLNPIYAELLSRSTGQVLARSRHMVVHGDSVADGAFSLNGVALRIGDSGLDQIEPIIASSVRIDPATLLPVGSRIVSNYCAIRGLFGLCLGHITARIAAPPPGIAGFSIDTDSHTNFVAGDIDISNFRADLDLDGSGIAPDCGLRLRAASTQILGDYALSPDAANRANVDVNQIGSPNVSFTGFRYAFTYGLCDFPLIGDLIRLIAGNLEPTVVAGFEEALDDPDGSGPADAPVADAIEVALADLALPEAIGEALRVNLEAPLFAASEDTAGVTLGTDARITSERGSGAGECTPPPGAPDLRASYHAAEPFPTFGSTSPSGLPYQIAVAISTSTFNQLLKAQIECGLLRTSLREIDIGSGPQPVTAGLLRTFLPTLAAFDPAMPMRIDLEPTLAPFLTGDAGPGGELAELRIAQLDFRVQIDDGRLPGNRGLIIRGTIDARAGVDLTFDDLTSQLEFRVGPPTDVQIALLDNYVSANEAGVVSVLGFILPDLLPSIANGLAAFPLPSFFGLNLEGVEIARTGRFYSLYANLVR
jgi:hypothetical protein